MASQYSILRNYGKYISPYNTDVMMKGMAYMQEKVDANRKEINDYADYIINADIIKPQDREYLMNKLNGLISDVNNKYRRSNLASDGISRSIQAHIGEALDTKVLNAIAGTREYRNFAAKMEDMKLNNPKQYSAINEAVAIMPFQTWYNDGQVGTRMNPIHYTPYTDYNEEMNKAMKDFVSLNKGKKFSVPEYFDGKPTGRMREITVDEMSRSQIRAVAERSISQNAKAQMQIEGQYLAMTNPQMFSGVTTEQFANKYVARFDREEQALMAKLKGAEASPTEKNAIMASLQEVREQRKALLEEANSFIGETMNPARAGEFIVRNEFLDGVSSRWSYNNSSESYKADDYYFKMSDRDFKEREFAWRQRAKEMDQKLRMRAIEAKEAENANKKAGDVATGVLVELEKPEKNVTPENVFDENYLKNERSISAMEGELIKGLNPNDFNGIVADIENNADTYPGGATNENIVAWIRNNGGAASACLASPKAVSNYGALVAANDDRKTYSKIIKEEEDYLAGAFEAATGNILDDATDNQYFVTGGIDVYTDNGSMNARDMARSNVQIGGKNYDPETALKLSAIFGLMGENMNYYIDVSPENPELMRSYIGLINKYTGEDFTSDEVLNYLNVLKKSGMDVASKLTTGNEGKDKILDIIGKNAKRTIGPTFRREWSSSEIGRNIAKAVQDSKSVYERRYDEFAPRAYTFSNDANASKGDKAMHSKLVNLFMVRSGDVSKNKESMLNSYVMYAKKTDNPNMYDLVATSSGGQSMTVQVTKEELDNIGYSIYERNRNVRSEDYESEIIPVSFAATTNRAYQKWANANNLGSFATIENAAESAVGMLNGYSIPKNESATNALNSRATRVVNTVLRNFNKYEVRAKGAEDGVEVGIYYRGQAKDGVPLKVLEYDTNYADYIRENIDMCPQLFLVQGIVEALNKDAIVKGRDINEQHSDLSNLLSVLDEETINRIDNGQQQ